MTKLAAQIAAQIAAQTFAALPLAAGAAQAAPKDRPALARIQVKDLGLRTPAGLAEFRLRAQAAQRTSCDHGRSLTAQKACSQAVQAEVSEKLAAAQRSQHASRAALAAR